MDSLLLAVSVVVPLTVYMLIGGLIKKLKILDENNFKRLNEMIFRVLIPLTLFFDVYTSDLRTSFQPKLFLTAFVMLLMVFACSWVIVPRFVRDKRDSATIVQGIYRSNYVLFGTAIGASLCGEAGAAVTAALAVLVVPMVNILAVILFETLRGGNVRPGKLILHVFQNPLVDAGILGAVCNLVGLQIPDILAAPLTNLGKAATPMALVVLGGLLSFHSMASHKVYLTVTVLFRLIVVPLIALTVCVVMGFRNETLVALMAAFASPASVSSAPMAQSMGGNGPLAGEIVAVSSVGSILTIFLFVIALSGLGYI